MSISALYFTGRSSAFLRIQPLNNNNNRAKALHFLIGPPLLLSARTLGHVRQRELLQPIGAFKHKFYSQTVFLFADHIFNLILIQVLDRLNALFEPGGELVISERGLDSSGLLTRFLHDT